MKSKTKLMSKKACDKMQKLEEICRWKLAEIFVDFPIQSKAEWHSASKGVVEDLKFLFWMHRMLVYKRGTIKVYVKYTGNSGPEKKNWSENGKMTTEITKNTYGLSWTCKTDPGPSKNHDITGAHRSTIASILLVGNADVVTNCRFENVQQTNPDWVIRV